MPGPGSTREAILEYIEERESASGPELAKKLGITRQAVNLHLRRLIADGAIFKTGSTRAARYHVRGTAPAARTLKQNPALAGLDESRVYDQIALKLNLSVLPENVESIVHYAFTEMLNNAIDHSGSKLCRIEVGLDASHVCFEIRDRGIGVFQSIARKLALPDEPTAMVDLVKGKTTTQPDAHSGEGIFFVSRAADRLTLRSHRLQITWDRIREDVFVSDRRFIAGTLVQFELDRHSRSRLESVFEKFAPADYDFRFEKTHVAVKLLRRNYVSRSEAKRLLHNLDRFSEIELDMRGVDHVGQGFADEVFRVFRQAHPGIRIDAFNAPSAVAAMIAHVRSDADSPRSR